MVETVFTSEVQSEVSVRFVAYRKKALPEGD
jgi:hypothetical protein